MAPAESPREASTTREIRGAFSCPGQPALPGGRRASSLGESGWRRGRDKRRPVGGARSCRRGHLTAGPPPQEDPPEHAEPRPADPEPVGLPVGGPPGPDTGGPPGAYEV